MCFRRGHPSGADARLTRGERERWKNDRMRLRKCTAVKMLERLEGVKSLAGSVSHGAAYFFVPETSALNPVLSVIDFAMASGFVFEASKVTSARPFG